MQSCTNSNSLSLSLFWLQGPGICSPHGWGRNKKLLCVELLLAYCRSRHRMTARARPNRICLLNNNQHEIHSFYQKVNDVFYSAKLCGNGNQNMKAIDWSRLFGMLYQCYSNYHGSINQIISHNHIFNYHIIWVYSQWIQNNLQCIPKSSLKLSPYMMHLTENFFDYFFRIINYLKC